MWFCRSSESSCHCVTRDGATMENGSWLFLQYVGTRSRTNLLKALGSSAHRRNCGGFARSGLQPVDPVWPPRALTLWRCLEPRFGIEILGVMSSCEHLIAASRHAWRIHN